MRYIAILFMFVALFSGCRKNDGKPDAKPNWAIATDVDKEFSMTYIVKVSVTNEVQPLLEKDELAAFIGTECRGIATIVTNDDNKNCFYLLIYGNQNDTQKLSFKYYSSQKGRIFESVPIESYFPNQIVGSVDTPILFEF